jgi:hypothetical protein
MPVVFLEICRVYNTNSYLAKHHNGGNIVFGDHSPEVHYRVRQRVLGDDEALRIIICC